MTVLPEGNIVEGPPATAPARCRPVILATLSFRFEPEAERMAIESALYAGAPLVVVNLLWPPPCLPAGIKLQGDLEAVRGTASRATAAGVETELLMLVAARRASRALPRLARGRDAGLVVFGPDPRRTGRRRFRRDARAVCDGLDCLVWVGGDVG